MFYYTQLIYAKEGKKEQLNDFEEQEKPLLQRYNGQLLYRIRPDKTDIVNTEIGHPDEIHLLTFQTRDDLNNYLNDETRRKIIHLKQDAVTKVLLIEGEEWKQ